MISELRRYPFLGPMIEGAPDELGVYLLWEGDEVTYIGTARSIRTRLQDHLSGRDHCSCNPTHYSWKLARFPSVLESELLAEYRYKFKADPRCNRTAA